MDEDEKKLFELFAQKKDLVNKEPSFVAAFGPPADTLDKAREEARGLYAQGPKVQLSDEQRANVAGGRFPDLQGVVRLFGDGLAKHPEIVAEINIKPATIDRVVRLDRAFGRLVWMGQMFARGGESGELLTGAAAQGLCLGAIKQAQSRQEDAAVPEGQRIAIKAAFTEANRVAAEQKDRQAQAKQTAAQGDKPYKDQISQAQEDADMSRVIEAFLASQQKEKNA